MWLKHIPPRKYTRKTCRDDPENWAVRNCSKQQGRPLEPQLAKLEALRGLNFYICLQTLLLKHQKRHKNQMQ